MQAYQTGYQTLKDLYNTQFMREQANRARSTGGGRVSLRLPKPPTRKKKKYTKIPVAYTCTSTGCYPYSPYTPSTNKNYRYVSTRNNKIEDYVNPFSRFFKTVKKKVSPLAKYINNLFGRR